MFPMYRLVVHTGPIAGKAFPLEKNEIYIGRDLGNDIVINDPEMSRRHARLFQQGTSYVIEDMGSTNGTYVNGQRLMGPYILRPGEVITFGERISMVLESSDPNAGATIASAGHGPVVQQPVAPPPVAAYTPPAAPPSYAQAQPVQQPRYTPPPQAYVPPQSVEIEQEVVTPERPRSRTWLAILIGVLLLLCLCIFAAFAIDVTDSWCWLFGWFFNAMSPGLCP